jgi:PKD repeat protein
MITTNASITKYGIKMNRTSSIYIGVESYPDLAVSSTDISFSSNNPYHDETITIDAKIHNIGDANASLVKITFSDGDLATGGTIIGETVINVPSGGTATACVSWTATYGSHPIFVSIDPFNSFLEEDYFNNKASKMINVVDDIPPIAEAGPNQKANVGSLILLDGSDSKDNVGIVDYRWDIDATSDSDNDGIPDNDVDYTDMNVMLYSGYNTPGWYLVRLTVKDAAGNTATDLTNIQVVTRIDLEKPVANAGPNQTVMVKEQVSFDGSGSIDNFGLASYFWDIDLLSDSDGDQINDNDVDLTGRHPTLTNGYFIPGEYLVKLSVNDMAGNGPVEDTLSITVLAEDPNVNSWKSCTEDEGTKIDFATTFSDQKWLETHSVSWDFGDGTVVTGNVEAGTGKVTASHTYGDDGVYSVALKMVDEDGPQSVDFQIAYVNNVAPTAKINNIKQPSSEQILTNDELELTGSFSDPGMDDIHTIEWNFGDGTIVTGSLTTTHKYTEVGEYTVTLTVTDDDGGIGRDTSKIIVNKVEPDGTLNDTDNKITEIEFITSGRTENYPQDTDNETGKDAKTPIDPDENIDTKTDVDDDLDEPSNLEDSNNNTDLDEKDSDESTDEEKIDTGADPTNTEDKPMEEKGDPNDINYLIYIIVIILIIIIIIQSIIIRSERKRKSKEVEENIEIFNCIKCDNEIVVPFSENEKIVLMCQKCGSKGKISNPYLEKVDNEKLNPQEPQTYKKQSSGKKKIVKVKEIPVIVEALKSEYDNEESEKE